MQKHQPKQIFFISTDAKMAVNFRRYLIADLIARNFTVSLFANNFDAKTRKEVQDLGAIAVDSPLNRSGLNPIKDIYATFKLYKLFKQKQPDIVFCNFAKPVIFATIAAYCARVKSRVVMIEGLGYYFTNRKVKPGIKDIIIKRIQIFLYKLALPLADLVIMLNKDDIDDLLNKNNIRIKRLLLLGGIGVKKLNYKPKKSTQKIVFIFVGRLLFDKGIMEFIVAARILQQKYQNANKEIDFVALGDIDEQNPAALHAKDLEELRQENIIKFKGFVDDISKELQSASVFVLPSYREGMPRSTQEAMMHGLPIITTDVPGCRETVIEGQNGFIVPPFSAAALADKMEYFIKNPDAISKMGKASHALACEKFVVEEVNGKIIEEL